MIDLITSCWGQFVTIYALGKTVGIVGGPYLLCAIIIFDILRFIYKYAAGDSIGKPTHSAWILRFLDWFFLKAGWDTKTEFLDDESEPIPFGFNLLGMLFNIGITGIILTVLLLIWPGILLIAITFGPLQWCRNRNMRKKEFVARLRGSVRGTEAR